MKNSEISDEKNADLKVQFEWEKLKILNLKWKVPKFEYNSKYKRNLKVQIREAQWKNSNLRRKLKSSIVIRNPEKPKSGEKNIKLRFWREKLKISNLIKNQRDHILMRKIEKNKSEEKNSKSWFWCEKLKSSNLNWKIQKFDSDD